MRTPTVHVMIGPPASGKSTEAKQWVDRNPNLVRLNRDDFRMSFFNKTILNKEEERRLTRVIRKIAVEYLKDGKDLVLDNTHCNLATLMQVENDYNEYANISYHPYNVEYKTLIERNSKRELPVPEDVIKRMYKAFQHIYGSFDFNTKPKREMVKELETTKYRSDITPIYIFDIDRTLCNTHMRNPYDFQRANNDIPIPQAIDLHSRLEPYYTIFYITGRPDSCRDITREWLNRHTVDSVDDVRLLMRKEGDNRSSKTVKEEIYNEFIKDKYHVVGWFDDDEEVVEMLKRYDVQVYNTAQY